MGDHTETLQVDFDPEKVTYGELLDIFWNSHSYTRGSGVAQYKNAVFYHNGEQHQQALESMKVLERNTGKRVRTDILPLKSFTLAEDYHQKYLLKGSAMKHLLDTYYPRHDDLVNSTAAARLNGYAGQNGTKEQLLGELKSLGLREGGERILKKLAVSLP
jgi:peptide methionine sulfoxide reductase MsrA